MYCSQCGTRSYEIAKFCHVCGTPIGISSAPELQASTAVGRDSSVTIGPKKTSLVEPKIGENNSKGVKGWLLFLCISMIILGPLLTIGNLSTNYNAVAPFFKRFPGVHTATLIQIYGTIALLAFGVCAGVALWSRAKNAVALARKYFWTCITFWWLILFVTAFVANLPKEVTNEIIAEGMVQAIVGSLSAGLWLLYLSRSRRVFATYTNEVRPAYTGTDPILTCMDVLIKRGYKVKKKARGWEIREPLGGRKNIQTIEELQEYANSRKALPVAEAA
ncbi:MAG: zinc ribbon domain-containing protein [Nitrososphaera sp.]|nr:zinc ribbon domain-containing protein [Nitrososphaera sp.]